jgi:hypothetical protein
LESLLSKISNASLNYDESERSSVGWVERLFAIPIIGVQMIDGYRNVFAKPGSNPTMLLFLTRH